MVDVNLILNISLQMLNFKYFFQIYREHLKFEINLNEMLKFRHLRQI